MGRLYSRIYVHFLGVLLVVGLAASVVFAVGQRGAFQRQVVERLARHVGSLIAEQAHDGAGLARRLAQLHADLEVEVTVRDPEGRLVAATGAPLRELAPREAAALRAGEVLAEAGPVWFVAVAVRSPGPFSASSSCRPPGACGWRATGAPPSAWRSCCCSSRWRPPRWRDASRSRWSA